MWGQESNTNARVNFSIISSQNQKLQMYASILSPRQRSRRVRVPSTQGQRTADDLSTRPEKHNHWCCAASSLLNAPLSGQLEIILTRMWWCRPQLLFETEGPDTKKKKTKTRGHKHNTGGGGEKERDVTQSAPWNSVENQLNNISGFALQTVLP